jgi:hypothetical protein
MSGEPEVQVADARPIRLTQGELDQLSPEQRKRWWDEMQRQMYGHDAKKGRHGYIEQGIGSPGNENRNHFAALKQAELEGKEPAGSYDAAVAEIWARDPEHAKKCGLLQPWA